ncbi:MAG: ModE family transcriptional regulator [Oscillospiraceae bacterium]
MDETTMYNLTVPARLRREASGLGMARLPRKAQELHSLRAAAMSMNMAYSKAWTITKKAQEALGFPLLHSVTGGRGGGGAELTPEAVRMMAAYDDYCRKLRAYADDLFQEEFGYLQEENGGL